MTKISKCSYEKCQREAWRPTEGVNPFCIFHSHAIEEKREDFAPAWNAFLAEHRNDKGQFHDMYYRGFVFPGSIGFSKATFSNDAVFWDATFSGTADFGEATFSENAVFWNATFSGYSRFCSAKFNKKGLFEGADFTGANLSDGSFSNCSFEYVKYTLHRKFYLRKPSKWYKLREYWKVLPPTDFTGIETGGILAASNRQFVRDIEDQQFITQFKKQHKIWYYIWLYTCDCGRNFLLFLFVCFIVVFIFGLIYSCNAEVWFKNSDTWSWITPFYYSIFTFFSFGFGDVTPYLSSGWAQATVMLEVFLGYLGLGGLISIFANKLARRA